MRILLLDIETSPNTAYVWGLWDQNISHEHLQETGRILCWSAKWYGAPTTQLMYRECRYDPADPLHAAQYRLMMTTLHDLLSSADVVVHYYGSKFDIPTVNKEFAKLKILPPAPYKQIDLKLVVGKVFRFESNKLDYVAEQLGFGKKIKTEFSLWVDCVNGVPKAWEYMKKYNKHDVVLLEKVYVRLLPWIEKHPTWGAYKDGIRCPKCGSTNCQKRGSQVAQVYAYTRYQCQACGGWFRDNKTITTKGVRSVNIIS